jgi:hypothetical protein
MTITVRNFCRKLSFRDFLILPLVRIIAVLSDMGGIVLADE